MLERVHAEGIELDEATREGDFHLGHKLKIPIRILWVDEPGKRARKLSSGVSVANTFANRVIRAKKTGKWNARQGTRERENVTFRRFQPFWLFISIRIFARSEKTLANVSST